MSNSWFDGTCSIHLWPMPNNFNQLKFTQSERDILDVQLDQISTHYERVNKDEKTCKCSLKRTFLRNPARHRPGQPKQLIAYRAAFAVENGWLPKWPGTISHRCHLGNCLEVEHMVAEKTGVNISRTHCRRRLKKNKEKGAILKCKDHTPPCFLNWVTFQPIWKFSTVP